MLDAIRISNSTIATQHDFRPSELAILLFLHAEVLPVLELRCHSSLSLTSVIRRSPFMAHTIRLALEIQILNRWYEHVILQLFGVQSFPLVLLRVQLF
jgi:hypothetical protein